MGIAKMTYISSVDGSILGTKEKLIEYESRFGIERDDVQARLMGIDRPLCKCGCGGKVKFVRGKNRGWNDYLQGHGFKMQVNPSTGTKGTQAAKDKMVNALKERKKGIEEGYRPNWNTGQTQETNASIKAVADSQRNVQRSDEDREKISKGFKRYLKELRESGEYHRKFNNHMREYWKDPKHREEQSVRSCNNIQKQEWKKSQFEIDVENFLNENNIKYKNSFRLSGKGYNKVYDFLIDDNILVECDGDFLHCNPIQFPNGPTYDRQKYHIENDKIKNDLAKQLGYRLVRIWLSEFYKNKTLLLDRINVTKNSLEHGVP